MARRQRLSVSRREAYFWFGVKQVSLYHTDVKFQLSFNLWLLFLQVTSHIHVVQAQKTFLKKSFREKSE